MSYSSRTRLPLRNAPLFPPATMTDARYAHPRKANVYASNCAVWILQAQAMRLSGYDTTWGPSVSILPSVRLLFSVMFCTQAWDNRMYSSAFGSSKGTTRRRRSLSRFRGPGCVFIPCLLSSFLFSYVLPTGAGCAEFRNLEPS